MLARFQRAWRAARWPLLWMTLAIVLLKGYEYGRHGWIDHLTYHRLVAWANQTDPELKQMRSDIQGLKERLGLPVDRPTPPEAK